MLDQEAVNREAKRRFDDRKKQREKNLSILERIGCGEGSGDDWKIESLSRLAHRARRLRLVADAEGLLLEPESGAVGARLYERIIAANNLLDVEFLFEGAKRARAVGRITLPVSGGTRLGTGFLVAPRVMLTNNHVLARRGESERAVIEFDFYTRENGSTGPVERHRLQPNDLFITDSSLDFTLVAVESTSSSGEPLEGRGWFPLIGSSGKAVVGERVSIIQHPNGDPQKVVVHDNRVVDVDTPSHFLHYQADTMGGSSGSPVLNMNWDLAAVHHAAVGNLNEGVRISSIVSHLRALLNSESASSGSDRRLLAELLNGGGAPPPPTMFPGTGSPLSNDGPRIGPDGRAEWVVPVTISLSVGDTSGLQPPQPRTVPQDPVPLDVEPDLSGALAALDEASHRVYYSKKKDEQARLAYYPESLTELSKSKLFGTLSDLLQKTHTTTLNYRKARLEHLYPWIDRREDSSRQLRGIYSNKVFDALEIIRRDAESELQRERVIRERLLLESTAELDESFLEELEASHPFNCEHVVPQSWFGKRKTPKCDLHHLFTCESRCNSFRGNRAYFDFSTEAFREDCGELDDRKFEPQRGKGAVARATLYFLLRYPGDIADTAKEMPKDRLKILIDWAKNDKVDRWEHHRNAEIEKVQGNRNPLIDFPELVDKIAFEEGWG